MLQSAQKKLSVRFTLDIILQIQEFLPFGNLIQLPKV